MKRLTEIKRDDIIQAAKDEFRDNGFSATSMDRIAEVAGVSKRTVYNHFDSKEALFKAVAQDMCDIFQRISDFPYDPSTPLRAQLKTIATRQMDLLRSERFLRLFKMLTAEALAAPEITRPIVENLEKENVGLVGWINEARDDGKLNISNPVWASRQFLALLEAFTSWPYLYGLEPIQEASQCKEIIDSALDMFLGQYATEA